MAKAPDARSSEAARPRRARTAVLAGALTVALLSPTLAAAETAPAPPSVAGGAAEGSAPRPPSQIPANDPDFVDVPLATNPISPSLADVAAESDELSAADDALEAAEDRRDGAIAEQDRLRDRIVDLAAERAETVDVLAERREIEAQRGRERVVRVAAHARRIEEAEAAQRALERARDALRDLLVANYMSESTTISDIGSVLSGKSGVNDALVRLSLGESSVAARARDIDDRTRDRDAAVDARTRAAEARAEAEQAERDAIAARQEAEQHIRDLDAETRATMAEEAEAVVTVGRREAEVLVALSVVTPARLRADVVGLDFQLVALDAWLKAAASAECTVEWWMLAGISKIEGRHGTFGGGQLGARGYPSTRIIGPALNGTNGNANIGDTDGGLYDDDAVLDHAVGPMQFIPSTWARWGRDGDGDGTADPHTFYDATAAAAAYLCAGRTDLTDEAQLRAAYFSYNHSLVYVTSVLSEARRYQAALQVPPHVAGD